MAHMAQEIWNSVKIEIDEKGTHETKPQNKQEWQEVAYAARGLAEASTLLMYEGRVEDHGEWEKYVKQMVETSMEAAKAAEDQDIDALITAGGNIYEVCTNCHMAYLDKVMMKRTGGKPAEAPVTAPPSDSSNSPSPGQVESQAPWRFDAAVLDGGLPGALRILLAFLQPDRSG